MGRLQGRKIVITGAGSGIGAAITANFAGEGAAVAMLDRNRLGLEAAGPGIAATRVVVDVTDPDEVEHAIDAVSQALGGIDGLVNAAGVLHVASFEETERTQWQRMLDVNLTGPWNVCRAALPHLRRASAATIVNISSGLALRPVPGYSAYAASKSGLGALTRALAVELAPDIRVNAVCPGAVETPMTRDLYLNPKRKSEAIASYPLARLADTSEVANAVLFLTSADSSFTTGATLTVDGGRTLY
jgi:NAD(P)-dependent dehydrogenase (short-subunit alcohol dehydrogenase family)